MVSITSYNIYSRLPRKPIQAKQSVTVTGLGIPIFDNYAKAALELRTVLSTELQSHDLQPWTPQTYERDIALHFANRYLVTSKEEEHTPNPRMIDPFNILANAVPQGKYTSDNEVLYFEQKVHPDTK